MPREPNFGSSGVIHVQKTHYRLIEQEVYRSHEGDSAVLRGANGV